MRALSSDEWTAGLAAGVGVTPFHDWDWLHGQANMQGWRCEPLLIRRGQSVIGTVPLLLHRRGPFWLSASAPFLYAGPIVRDEDAGESLLALRRWSRTHAVLVTRLDFPAGDRPAVETALLGSGCAIEKPNTFLLDLSGGVDGVRSRYNGSVRSSIKSAAKNGVTVSDSTEQDVVELLPAILSEAFAFRDLGSPYPPDIGSWAWQHLINRASILKTAHLGDKRLGLFLAIGEGNTMYGWAGGAFREFRKIRPSHALHAAVFETSSDLGYHQFDLLGEVDEGVAKFKTGFGAIPTQFILAQQTTYPLYGFVRTQMLSHRQSAPETTSSPGNPSGPAHAAAPSLPASPANQHAARPAS